MKTKILFSTLLSLLLANSFAQDRTTVNAMSSEISDNLDLRAVASIFGDSKNLEDFENRLNDPKNQISNLDLNNDNQVDYLRVIESVEGRTHLIVVQSVLGRDTFQDVATLEVEKDRNNRIQVQVVGDVYMYGSNYIYEPVYVNTPIIYDYFWVPNYRPYCSLWYWDYYPSYYYAWNPCPIFRYRSHIGFYINFNHHYNYVNYRRCQVAYSNYYGRRGNGYERQHPNYSFERRNSGYSNRYELDKTRNIRTVGSPRNEVADNNSPRNNADASPRNSEPRNIKSDSPRDTNYDATPRDNTPRNIKTATPRDTNYDATPRDNTPRNIKTDSPRDTNYDATPRTNTPRNIKNDAPRENTSPRTNDNGNSTYSTPRSQPKKTMTESPRSASPRNNENSSPRSSEPRNNSSSNTPRDGGQTRSSGRR